MSGGQTLDAVIVGAGAGGLAVAEGLVAHGRSVLVLEARSRVGGRLLSVDGLDLGATWFWPNEPRVNALIARLGLDVHDQYIHGDALFHIPGGAERLEGNPLDVPSGRIVGGVQGLAQAMAERLPEGVICRNTRVTAIQAHPDRIAVATPEGSVAARHVVIALPPALAMQSIRVTPDLPDDLALVARATPVWMGAITKVVVRYGRPFWRAAGLAGAAISHIGPLREIHDMSGPGGSPAALFGFAPAARRDEPELDERAVVAQLVELFGAEAASPLEVKSHDWRTDANTSPPGVEDLITYEAFGHACYQTPAFGRIHWASTETAPEFAGHIEGALAAAHRTVRAIGDSEGLDVRR